MHVCIHQHTRPHAHTPTRPPLREHKSTYPDTEPSPGLGYTRPHLPHAPVPLSLQFIHPLLSWFLSLCNDSAKTTDRRCGWLGRGCGSGGADRGPGRREGGGDGAGSGRRRAALPALQRARRPRLSADALAPARGSRTPFRGISRTSRGGGRGRARAQPEDSAPGIRRPKVGVQAGARRPQTPSPGTPSWCWGLWHGDRVAPEGLVIWKALGCTEDFKGLLWSLPSGACAERGPAFLGKGCDHVALNS